MTDTLNIALHHVQADGALDRRIICDGLNSAKDEIENLRSALEQIRSSFDTYFHRGQAIDLIVAICDEAVGGSGAVCGGRLIRAASSTQDEAVDTKLLKPITTIEEFYHLACEWRNIETPCPECGGSGVKTYGDTSTFRGGVGGQTITTDVCDKCWGSGDKNSPWPRRIA